METFRDLTAEKAVRAELTQKYTFRNIVTKNPKMQPLLRLLETVAETEATVLLEGESGYLSSHLPSGKRGDFQEIFRESPKYDL